MSSATFPMPGLARWLIAPRRDVGPGNARHLTSGLFSSLPIFLGGVINSVVVALLAATRHPALPFIAWFAAELSLGMVRLFVVARGQKALLEAKAPPVTLAVVLACAWAASIGTGTYLCISAEDWVLATICCMSATGMVSGICLRNFGTPRLVMVMMMLCLLPCAFAALISHKAIILVIALQLPVYMMTIGAAAFRLNTIVIERMTAQDALERSEAFNRSILESSPDYTLLLDDADCIAFCNTPAGSRADSDTLIGVRWLDLLPVESRTDGGIALESARRGEIARVTVRHADGDAHRWFDLAVSLVSDGSNRTLIVARDITHQKTTEERALWMANHDALTALPNRVVLQARLDKVTARPHSAASALLVLDVDNFKLINDTLGHDAGDALLCGFADRLRSSLRSEDLVARLGGDEFAVVLQASSEAEIQAAADKIYAELHKPFVHNERLIECGASIGACLFPRDGTERSELMKAADIALYSAKSSGRGQLKIFESGMRNEFQTRNSMIFLARRALATRDLIPHYQPKVCLRSGKIDGFEALLRWRDPAGRLQPPEKIKAAFEDPLLSAAISARIIDQTLADIRTWLNQGVPFGHVAINVAAAEFRSGRFAEELLQKMEERAIPTDRLQIEVTETVFLGRGADHVQHALFRLSKAGLRIALDDFGTGYASLAHLMQFPVSTLKIDRSFVKEIGKNADAEAITKAIVQLGKSLDIDVIAEGVERPEQEDYLKALGCHSGQGFLYSKAVAPHVVTAMLTERLAQSA